jgi:hypothetical protein
MTNKVILNPESLSQLNGLASGAPTELCDASGRTLGYFVPAAGPPSPAAEAVREERDRLRACLDRLRVRLEEALRVRVADDAALEGALEKLQYERDAYLKSVYYWEKQRVSDEGMDWEAFIAECTLSGADLLADLEQFKAEVELAKEAKHGGK